MTPDWLESPFTQCWNFLWDEQQITIYNYETT